MPARGLRESLEPDPSRVGVGKLSLTAPFPRPHVADASASTRMGRCRPVARSRAMSARPEDLQLPDAELGEAVTRPFPNSRKTYVSGSRPDRTCGALCL